MNKKSLWNIKIKKDVFIKYFMALELNLFPNIALLIFLLLFF